ncbi:MAG: ornithine cyclodeaminase family protein [Mariniblastus sp.]|nr:ornithine cyclodeaminase family protein [Mariniblastus sp.]
MNLVPYLTAEEIRERTPYPELIATLDDVFRGDATAPPRHHHQVPQGHGPDATLLIMPAWRPQGSVGVKVVNVYPENGARGLPAVQGIYLLFHGQTGELVALADGPEITARRTAAASALASRYLASEQARVMLMVGTGRLSRELIRAHRCVRNLDEVLVWGRDPDKAQAVVQDLDDGSFSIRAVPTLESAARQADLISTATLARQPLIEGAWLKPGSHLDLVGSYRADMRETDDEVMRRATAVYVDTRAGALSEGGDLVQTIASGALDESKIVAELADLARGYPVQRPDGQITVFKSVGASIEDLAAAELCLKNDLA